MTKGVENNSKIGDVIACCDGSIVYEVGIDHANKLRAGVEIFKSDYDVGNVDELNLANFGFKGETFKVNAFGSYQFIRGKQHNEAFQFSVSQIAAETRRSTNLLSEDKLTIYQSGYDFDRGDQWLGNDHSGRNYGIVQLSSGKLSHGSAGNSRLEADDHFI